MPTSQARIDANIQNAARSTGPRTDGGKRVSARNSWKHGLTGAGIVVSEQDSAEIERRNEALQAELAPKTAMGLILVRQMATVSVRMERAAKQESVAIAEKVRHAVEDFDRDRLDEADRLLDVLGEAPRLNLRKLRSTPEGVERLIETWQELRDALTGSRDPSWTVRHQERFENLNGRRAEDLGGSKTNALSRAVRGDLSGLTDSEGAGLEGGARQAWAAACLVERIDAAIAGLEANYEALDFEMIEADRAEAPDRALFDPSKQATLARRYESQARRCFSKSWNDLRQVEAEAAAAIVAAPAPGPESRPAALASSRQRPSPGPREPRPTPSPALPSPDSADVASFLSLQTRPKGAPSTA